MFVWDLGMGEVAWRMDRRLEGITGGFGYQPPAWLSANWDYLLLVLKGGEVELGRLNG